MGISPPAARPAALLALALLFLAGPCLGGEDALPHRGAPAAPQQAGGLTAADIKAAYGIPYLGVPPGITVGVVAWCDHPTAAADLAVYRAASGLPPCTAESGCFRKVNQVGLPGPFVPNPAACAEPATLPTELTVAREIALDIEMVSAVCPSCSILLVLANDATPANLWQAVATTVALGASVVTMGFAMPEALAGPEPAIFAAPGRPVAFFAPTGDRGFNQAGAGFTAAGFQLTPGVSAPATFPHVIAVGGTILTPAPGTPRGYAEVAYNFAGSGCSAITPNPAPGLNTGCGALRAVGDVSAVAVNVNMVLNGVWRLAHGGHHAIVASIFALTGNSGAGPTWPYLNRGRFLDIISGAVNVPPVAPPPPPAVYPEMYGPIPGTCTPPNLCNGWPGYDAPTGVGVWYPVAPTCEATICPAELPLRQPDHTVCASLAGCTWAECCRPVGTRANNNLPLLALLTLLIIPILLALCVGLAVCMKPRNPCPCPAAYCGM